MKQLGTLDSAFINLENSSTPQHIGGLGIYDPSSAPGGFVRFKDVLANFEQRLTKLPLFRTRLVQVPGDIDRPYWVEDPNFDVEFHIRHISLPKPGDWRQLFIQAARLHSRSLDMARPLWEVYIIEGLDKIEGLPEGAFAMYTKMHHSMVDGAGGAAFLSALHDLEPNPTPSANPIPETILFDRQPTDRELLARALVNRTTNSIGMLRSIGSTAVELAKYGMAVSREEVPSPDLAAPKTRFNRKVGPHRVADGTAFDLQQIKQIKNATNSTVNDVALAMIGGALRNYLTLHGELPTDSLAASIPMNMRARRAESNENNQIGSTFAELHTNIADPLERIAAVHESTQVAKSAADSSPMVEAMRVAGFFSPVVSKAAAAFWSKNELSRFIPMNTSTVVTNVPGPNFPLYCAGAKMVRYHGLGLLTPGCGLFHTVFSCDGLVTVTILADRVALPDPNVYVDCLRESFKEMYLSAVGSEPQPLSSSEKAASAAQSKAKAEASKTAAQTKTQPKTQSKGRSEAQPKAQPKSGPKPKPKNKLKTKPKSSAKKSVSAKASGKKTLAKKSPDKKTTAKKVTGKSTPSKKTARTKALAAKPPASKPARKKPARSLRSIKIPASAKRTTSSAKAKKKS